MSITNGNMVDFSTYINTDVQDLTSASLNGTDLIIAIENGASVTADLAPLVSGIQSNLATAQSEILALQNENTTQQILIDDLTARLEVLEQTLSIAENNQGKAKTAILYQNIPNPFNGTSSIKYYIPSSVSKAAMVFSNTSGQVISTITIDKRGDEALAINSDGLASGIYFYSLYVEGSLVDTKKMIIDN